MASMPQIYAETAEFADSNSDAYTIESVYTEALKQAKSLQSSGSLPDKYSEILLETNNPEDLLSLLDNDGSQQSRIGVHGKPLNDTVRSIVARLDRYADAIDMIAQSSPQAFGLNVVGMIWGSLKFLLVVARDITATHDLITETLDYIRQSLPVLGALTNIYGHSEVQLLREPLVDIYSAIISFGLQVASRFAHDLLSLNTLGRSARSSLQADFDMSLKRLKEAGQIVEQAANMEHMYSTENVRKTQNSEILRQEHFRRGMGF